MNKLILIGMMLFLLVLPVIFAQTVDSTDPLDYVWFDNASINHTGGVITIGDKPTQHGWNFNDAGGPGLDISSYVNYDGVQPTIQTGCSSGNNCLYFTDNFDVDDNFTVEYIFQVNLTGPSNAFVLMAGSTSVVPNDQNAGLFFNGGASNLQWQGTGFGCPQSDVGSGGIFAIGFNKWYDVTLRYNKTGITCEINGTKCTNSCDFASPTSAINKFMIFPQDIQNDHFFDFVIYNGTIRPQQAAPPDVTPPLVEIVNNTPANNSFSTSIIQVFNLSIIELNLDTIKLDFNGTNLTGFINDFGNFHSLTVNTGAEGLFTYQIHVNDTSGNSFVSGNFQFTIDNATPVVTFTDPTLDNLTTKTNLLDDIDINGFNINLDIANLTIFNATNEIIFQNVTSGITTNTFTFTNSYGELLLNQPDDDYTFRVCFIDVVNLETCGTANMTLDTFVPPAITGFATSGTSGIIVRVSGFAIIIVVLITTIAELTGFNLLKRFKGAKK